MIACLHIGVRPRYIHCAIDGSAILKPAISASKFSRNAVVCEFMQLDGTKWHAKSVALDVLSDVYIIVSMLTHCATNQCQ
jgi:hypothetical protein